LFFIPHRGVRFFNGMINYFETHITEACNLKCRGCSHFSVFAKPKHKDLGEFDREFKRLSEIETIGTMRLMGGEPLLNPDFMEYFRIARHYFPDSYIVLVTNGLLGEKIVPHIRELAKLRVDVTMSNYHLESQHLEVLDRIIMKQVHEKGQLYNISLDPSGSHDKEMSWTLCDIRYYKWYYFMDGRFYPCCIGGTIHDFWNHFGLDWGIKPEDISIDIFNHTAEEIEAFLDKPCELCRFCATEIRQTTYAPFSRSTGDIKEWTI